ncbi:hypothetical protein ACTJKJ_10685 [Roseateles sp. 22389]|uniref:hypothetical protein n=1 Tax=Roseateles sp. 22389 TaxID=3453916 RepID=UPI002607A712|nr:hypothetical protein [uncultured Roseateles sp.]
MSEIVLLDTSVLLNVLDIPGFNETREAVIAEFEQLIDREAHLFIPMAAVFETGNHIAQLTDGRLRRHCAERFVSAIQAAIDDQAPWKPMRMPDVELVRTWLNDFPEAAMRGHGMGDLSIRKEWQTQCEQFSMSRVRVWSLDQDLAGLDRSPDWRRAR